MKTREQAADEWVEKYAFRVPYNGTNDFYDKEAIRHGTAGFLAGCEFEAQNRWIPVSERLPELRQNVLCFQPEKEFTSGEDLTGFDLELDEDVQGIVVNPDQLKIFE